MKMMSLILLLCWSCGWAATKETCLEASRLSKPDAIDVCNKALDQSNLSLNDQSIIYITQAEYMIRNSQFEAANKVLDLAFNANPEMLKNGIFRLNWLRIKGSLFVTKEAFLDALPFYDQALEVAIIMDNKALIANGYNDLGAINLQLGKYQESLEWLQKSLVIHQQNDDQYRSALSLANIAEVYQLLDEYDQALSYYQQALDAHRNNLKDHQDQTEFFEPYIAHVHQNIGDVLILLNNVEQAAANFQQALSIYQKYQLVARQIKVLSNLGKLHLAQQDPEQALIVLNQALELEKTLESAEHLKLKENLVAALLLSKEFESAQRLALQGLKIAQSKANHSSQATFLKLLAEISEQQGDEEQALTYIKQYQIIQTKELEQKYNQSLIKLQSEIDAVQKQREITQLETEKKQQQLQLSQKNWMFSAITLVLLGMIFYLIRLLKNKNLIKLEVQKDQAIHSQLLADMSVDTIEFERLFRHIESPLVCFDATGSIQHKNRVVQSEKNTELDQLQTLCPDCWTAVINQLNDDEKLSQDIFIKHSNRVSSDYLRHHDVWIHQLGGFDDLMIALFIDPKDTKQSATNDADKIKKHSEYKQHLSQLWESSLELPIHRFDQYAALLLAMKNQQVIEPVIQSDAELKTLAVDLMTTCLDCWQQATGQDAIHLAEKSGLWLVSIDDGRLRMRTMNRYLEVQKMPKRPRWQQVIKTAHYVLSECDLNINQRQILNQKTAQLKHAIRSNKKPFALHH